MRMQPGTLLCLPAGGTNPLSGTQSGCKETQKFREGKMKLKFFEKYTTCQTQTVSDSAYPFVGAGSTQAAKEPIDHLNGTENQLQTACGQQSSKQSNVELHNVLRLCACSPPRVLSQVALVSMKRRKFINVRDFRNYQVSSESFSRVSPVFERGCPDQKNFAEGPILQTEHCHNETVQGPSHTHCSECN